MEEITRKTGHFQPFDAFVRMLTGSVEEVSSDAFLDILTYSDLLALKNRRKAGATDAPAASGNNKRYVILTHTAQERVHYPLPLAPDKSSRSAEPDGVVQQAMPMPAPVQPTASTPSLPRQYEDLLREKEEIQAAYERLQRDSSREISKIRRRCDDLAGQLQEQSDQMAALQTELMSQGGDARVVDSLKRKLQKLEEQSGKEIGGLQRNLDKHKKEVLLLNSELNRSKREEERLRRHVRQLEAELKMFQRRHAATSQREGRSSARSSPATTQSRVSPRPSSSSSRVPLAARSTASSRASSVASSTAASRAASVERGAGARTASRPASNAGSRPMSRAGSVAHSQPGSRASSVDRSRPASRASSTGHSGPPSRDSAQWRDWRARNAKSRAPQPPSIDRAAREALLQKAVRRHAGLGPAKSSALAQVSNRAPKAARASSSAPTSGRSQLRPASADPRARRAMENAANVNVATRTETQKENRAFIRQGYEAATYASKTSGVQDEFSPQSYDASDDIQDIDRRLNALQQFLTAAKAPR